jgi:plastocyanin
MNPDEMRPFARTALVAALAYVAIASGAPAAPAASAAPVAVGVGAREFSLSLYRTTVAPGVVRFNLTNFGEDGHDLAVIAPGGKLTGRIAEVRGAGGRGQVELRLTRSGRYTLLCTVADHAARGMRVKLRVKR